MVRPCGSRHTAAGGNHAQPASTSGTTALASAGPMSILAGILLLGFAFGATPRGFAGIVGAGTPTTCNESALEDALAGGGVVTFSCGESPATILVTRPKRVSSHTTIDGDGRITLDGGQTVRVFEIDPLIGLSLERLTIANAGSDSRGAILNSGRLEVSGCTFSANTTAIVNEGVLTVRGTTFRNNWGGDSGGAIANFGGSVSVASSLFSTGSGRAAAISSTGGGAAVAVDASTFSANSAGAIYADGAVVTATQSTFTGNGEFAVFNFDGVLAVDDCTFSGNVATGLVNAGSEGGVATVANSTFDANRSGYNGGAIRNGGTLDVQACSFRNNAAHSYGGAVYNSPKGVLTLRRSTLNDNSAYNGGGLYNDGAGSLLGNATLANSTLSGNSAGLGGGIANFGDATVANCTLTANTASAGNAWGGGLFNGAGRVSTLANNLFFYNSRGLGDCINAGGTVIDGGNNLLGDASCLLWNGVNGNLVGVDPRLDLQGLKDNGGPTATVALLAASPAIDAGDSGVCGSSLVGGIDQRGYVRPGRGSTTCSMGAFEYAATPPVCAGDCNFDGAATIDELVRMVNIALGTASIDTCVAGDLDDNGMIVVNELIAAVNKALEGCGDDSALSRGRERLLGGRLRDVSP